jgi:hypothetical protein
MTDQTNAQGADQHAAAQTETGLPVKPPTGAEAPSPGIGSQSEPVPRPEPEGGVAEPGPLAGHDAPHAAEPVDGAVEHDVVGEKAPEAGSGPFEIPSEPVDAADEPEPLAAKTPEAGPAKRKSSILVPIAGLVGAVLIGGAGYVAWQQFQAEDTAAPGIVEPAKPDVAKSDAAKSDAAKSDAAKSDEAKSDAAKSDAARNEMAPGESAASDAKAGSAAPVDTSPAIAAAPAIAGLSPAERELNDRLAQIQTQLKLVQQRLAATEAKLAAPKGDARALAASDAASSDASARLVLAQSVATALREDADASTLIGALEKLGADPQNIQKLRAGVSSPNLAKLSAEFTALSDRIVAAAAPSVSPNTAESTPKSPGDKVLAFLKSRAEKLVKVRASGSVQDQTAGHVAQTVRDLNAGNLAGALAEQALLPEPARAVSADWAQAAKARLDAEQAAKAEVGSALENLGKSKT